MSTRLVLMPQGQPADLEHRTHSLDLIRRCGGHWGKIIDGPAADIEAFGRHVARLKALDGRLAPLVVLTETMPLALRVIAARRTLEKIVPVLHQAAWIVVHDPVKETGFFQEAESMGVLDGAPEAAPIWSSPGGLNYLVLVPGVAANLEDRIVELLSRTTFPPDRGALTA